MIPDAGLNDFASEDAVMSLDSGGIFPTDCGYYPVLFRDVRGLYTDGAGPKVECTDQDRLTQSLHRPNSLAVGYSSNEPTGSRS